MDHCDKYALQREQMLRRQALELQLIPVASTRDAHARKRASLQTIESALAALNTELLTRG